MTDSHSLSAVSVIDLANGLRDPEAVAAAVSARAAHTLCYGLAGSALLHACLADAQTAAAHWNAASLALGNAPPDGIHTGPGALATSLIIGTGYLTARGPHHELVPRATVWLAARAVALAHRQLHYPPDQPTWAVYDSIKGLAGIGRILLAACMSGHEAEAGEGLCTTLKALTSLLLAPNGVRPGWWLPADAHPDPTRIPPSGAATTGLAHGVAGPLSLLSIAQLAGQTVPGQTDAVAVAAHWLRKWASTGPSWPPHISGADLDTDAAPGAAGGVPGRRTAWCYGEPGIASALTHAGRALNDRASLNMANAALNNLAADPTRWDAEGTGLCHGTAGLLQVGVRCSPDLAQTAVKTPGPQADAAPGFLNGTTGTALAVADHVGLLSHPPLAAWDSILLLS
ncbi:lanthionine synthetase LanC family protein [Streptomyces sp. SM12]|uniref:lanthionine synthetase LanC family protein n=1 Tax=Streptomyces sp. SM12 TaxID=1071602 RepID=UPI000CD50AF4|nr:lanthionine synthetase LanC family protein [Streptomyces sp. SM12]